eukprot:gnl/Chilomastix_cuspidata/1765.p1 GENE.gnl/Chilomastix_cuspidata/1765~~gnl/Chilomastix_cuspidata/1765.p1  ORF type:complete len:1130 (+),score=529.72 gnl/Chilomastix_cuspidata/1765:24-3392(+)
MNVDPSVFDRLAAELVSPDPSVMARANDEFQQLVLQPKPAISMAILKILKTSTNEQTLVFTCNVIGRVWFSGPESDAASVAEQHKILEAIFNTLVTHNTVMPPTCTRKLCHTYANILKLNWQDDRFKNTTSYLLALLTSAPNLCIIGLRLLRTILEEFAFKRISETISTNRRLVLSLKQHGLTSIFKSAFELLLRIVHGETAIEDPDLRFRLTQHVLLLNEECLHFTDYLHQSKTDSSSLSLPPEWMRALFPSDRPGFAVELFANTYNELSDFPSHSEPCLHCLIALASCQRPCFESEELFAASRQALVGVVAQIAQNNSGFQHADNLHSFCRLLRAVKNFTPLKTLTAYPSWFEFLDTLKGFSLKVFEFFSSMEASRSLVMMFWYLLFTGSGCLPETEEINAIATTAADVWTEYINFLLRAVAMGAADDNGITGGEGFSASEGETIDFGQTQIAPKEATAIGVLARSVPAEQQTDLLITMIDTVQNELKNAYAHAASTGALDAVICAERRMSALVYVVSWITKNRSTYSHARYDGAIYGRFFGLITSLIAQPVGSFVSPEGFCLRGSTRLLLKSLVFLLTVFNRNHVRNRKPPTELFEGLDVFFHFENKGDLAEAAREFTFKACEFYTNFVMYLLNTFPCEGNAILAPGMQILVEMNAHPTGEVLATVPAIQQLFEQNPLDVFPAPPPGASLASVEGLLKSSSLFYDFLLRMAWEMGRETQVAKFYKHVNIALEQLKVQFGDFSDHTARVALARFFRLLIGTERLFRRTKLHADVVFLLPHADYFASVAANTVDAPFIITPILRLILEILGTRQDRLQSSSRPLSFLLLRALSGILSAYLKGLAANFDKISPDDAYQILLKPISLVARILIRMLQGWKPPFHIIILYNDAIFHDLFALFLRHVSKIPVASYVAFPKIAKALTRVVEVLSEEHPLAFSNLEPAEFAAIWATLAALLDHEETEVVTSCNNTFANLVAWCIRGEETARAQESGNIFLHLMHEHTVPVEDVKHTRRLRGLIEGAPLPVLQVLNKVVSAVVFEDRSLTQCFTNAMPSLILFVGADTFLQEFVTRATRGKDSGSAAQISSNITQLFAEAQVDLSEQSRTSITQIIMQLRRQIQALAN